MNGRFETSGIFPLSVEPAEGYGSDPATRKASHWAIACLRSLREARTH